MLLWYSNLIKKEMYSNKIWYQNNRSYLINFQWASLTNFWWSQDLTNIMLQLCIPRFLSTQFAIMMAIILYKNCKVMVLCIVCLYYINPSILWCSGNKMSYYMSNLDFRILFRKIGYLSLTFFRGDQIKFEGQEKQRSYFYF